MKLQSVVLSGGSGTRLWPLSREKYPKQLINLFGQHTMLQETLLRMQGFSAENIEVSDEPVIVSNQEYRFITAEQVKQINIQAKIVLEPCGRNTAPALTTAAEIIQQQNDAIMLVMPADHLISDVAAFYQSVQAGLPYALNNGVVCFGIQPTRAETGYGYIKTIKQENQNIAVLDKFVEKPDMETAQHYVDSGEYYWNSGIFMLKASTWLSCIEKFNSLISTQSKAAVAEAQIDKDFIWLDSEQFAQSPEDSIDYAVMEHIGLNNAIGIQSFVVPMSAGWSDVGAWDAVWENSSKDSDGNVHHGEGNVVLHNAHNNMVHSIERRLITVLGLDDVVVVDTKDSLLIAAKPALPEIKELISKLKKEHIEMTQNGREVYRPWGSYDSLEQGDNFQVKRIVVNPGHVLSLQMHHHRAEHWIVVKGTGKITRGEEVFLLSENQSTYIPLGVVHRLENPGKFPLELIEVQSGSYLGEDDIVRLEDVYGRIAGK